MINLEHFHALREIQSLDLKISEHLKLIKAEEERITFILKQKEFKASELEAQEKEQSLGQKKLAKLERTLGEKISLFEKAKSRIPQLTSAEDLKATEKEISTLHTEKENLEGEVFQAMELQEQFPTIIKTLKNFLQGVEKSIEEIRQEVAAQVQLQKNEIENYEKRIQALLEICPLAMKSRFLAVNQKLRFKNPLAFVINHTCTGCHMRVNLQEQAIIDKGQSLEYCIHCGRIFIPSSLL